ncbi:hypothetical protein AB0F20_29755 [Streptomyces goshikiensis]|uniref:hypothetical protein n=1 Tax=Streptomyces goshikiensis TaxID=1942 RepID=UPI00340A7A70
MNTTVECQAVRRGRTWVVHVPEHGVYGCGRTLKAVRENTEQGLALVGASVQAAITPVTPELEALRSAEAAYAAALGKAVAALALRRTTLRDMAEATGVPVSRVKAHLAEKAAPAAGGDARDAAPDPNAEVTGPACSEPTGNPVDDHREVK